MAVRRWTTVGVVSLMGLGVGLQPIPAEATAGAGLVSYLNWGGPGGSDPSCPQAIQMSGAEGGNEAPMPLDGKWRTYRMSRSGTIASSAVRASATVQARAWSDARGQTLVGFSTSMSASAKPSGATVCSATVGVDTAASARKVSVPRTSWLVVNSSGRTSGSVSTHVGVQSSGGAVEVLPAVGTSVMQLIPAGTYVAGAFVSGSVVVPSQSTTAKSASATATATVQIIPPGTVRSQSGATGWVRSQHRNCSTYSVRMRITGVAWKRAQRLEFFLNGRKVKQFSGRAVRRYGVTIKRIPSKSWGKVTVAITTKSGARKVVRASTWRCR